MTTLATALYFASRGLAVFPVHCPTAYGCSCGNRECDSPAKHPYASLAPKGCHSASTDRRQITKWFDGPPFNLGIRTGKASGIVVVDVDPRHNGDKSLADLERRCGELPPTWRFLTGGGGAHIIFRHPGGAIPNSAGAVGPGIDVRGDGGYIVAPPSRHISGRTYQISVDHHPDDVPLADPPEWLVPMLRTSTHHNGTGRTELPEGWRKLIAEGVTEGQRNHAIARLSGHLLRKYIDPLVALDLLRCWNTCRCQPPLGDEELVHTFASICGREAKRRQAGNGGR